MTAFYFAAMYMQDLCNLSYEHCGVRCRSVVTFGLPCTIYSKFKKCGGNVNSTLVQPKIRSISHVRLYETKSGTDNGITRVALHPPIYAHTGLLIQYMVYRC